MHVIAYLYKYRCSVLTVGQYGMFRTGLPTSLI